jgi:tetratricopeptide (TPR) repeat protein
LFYPVSLAVLYPLDLRPALWEAGGSLAMLLTVTAAVILWGRRRGYLLMGWLWYLGTLVPVIGLVQAGNQSMADRYMYLPGIGIYIIVAWLTGEVAAKLRWPKIVPAAAGVLVLVVLLLITRVQVGYWKDSFSLCRHALAVTKDNEVIHNNLGCALGDKGLVGEAAAEFELAIKIRPGYARAHYNYGVTLAKRGLYDEAIEHFSKALATNPYCSNALHNLCKTGVVSGKLDVVLGVIRDLEQKTPANAELYYRAGTIYEKQGNIAAAIEQLEKALKLAGNEGRKELAGQIKERLESYQH